MNGFKCGGCDATLPLTTTLLFSAPVCERVFVAARFLQVEFKFEYFVVCVNTIVHNREDIGAEELVRY